MKDKGKKGHSLKYFLDHPQIKRYECAGNKKTKYSAKAQEAISHKMSVMKDEDRPHKQKVAIALNEAREKGHKVPKSKKKGK